MEIEKNKNKRKKKCNTEDKGLLSGWGSCNLQSFV